MEGGDGGKEKGPICVFVCVGGRHPSSVPPPDPSVGGGWLRRTSVEGARDDSAPLQCWGKSRAKFNSNPPPPLLVRERPTTPPLKNGAHLRVTVLFPSMKKERKKGGRGKGTGTWGGGKEKEEGGGGAAAAKVRHHGGTGGPPMHNSVAVAAAGLRQHIAAADQPMKW